MEITNLLKNAAKYFESDLPESFEISKGDSKIMVSAPHSVEQIRNGKIKFREPMTGALAIVLCRQTGCHAIYKTRNMGDDANFDEVSDYRNALADYIRQNNIKALIDLHQMAAEREEMVCIGTSFGENLANRRDFAAEAVRAFKYQLISPVTIDDPFAASHPFTVSSDISSRCGIPCLQIEINSSLLNDKSENSCTDKVFDALRRILLWADKNL